MSNDNQIQISVDRSDLLFLRRILDEAFSQLEPAIEELNMDEDFMIELDQALCMVEQYVK